MKGVPRRTCAAPRWRRRVATATTIAALLPLGVGWAGCDSDDAEQATDQAKATGAQAAEQAEKQAQAAVAKAQQKVDEASGSAKQQAQAALDKAQQALAAAKEKVKALTD